MCVEDKGGASAAAAVAAAAAAPATTASAVSKRSEYGSFPTPSSPKCALDDDAEGAGDVDTVLVNAAADASAAVGEQ